MNFDFLFGVFSGIAMSIFGLVGLEFYDRHKELKRKKDDLKW